MTVFLTSAVAVAIRAVTGTLDRIKALRSGFVPYICVTCLY